MCILPGQAVPEMTYAVSGGTLNPTHSLTQSWWWSFFCIQIQGFWILIREFFEGSKKFSDQWHTMLHSAVMFSYCGLGRKLVFPTPIEIYPLTPRSSYLEMNCWNNKWCMFSVFIRWTCCCNVFSKLYVRFPKFFFWSFYKSHFSEISS